MAAARRDFSLAQGTTFRRKLRFKLADVPVDITGWVFTGQIRSAISHATVVATIVCTVLDQDTNTGEVELYISHVNTSAIPLKGQPTKERVTEAFPYDIEVVYPSGDKERVYEGVFNISPEVTRV